MQGLQRDHSGRFYYVYEYICYECRNHYHADRKIDAPHKRICWQCVGFIADTNHIEAMKDYGGK